MKKIALCIGNNNYSTNELKCAENDANSVAQVLNNLGFEVRVHCNLDKDSMIDIIEAFFDSAIDSDVIVFYYAGHGCEINNENVLVPIDVDFSQGESSIRQKSYKLEELITHLGYFVDAKKFIILDACRSLNTNSRSFGEKGFSPISSPQNTFIAFSTSPNMNAMEDNDSGHGIYTGVLLEMISTPRIHVESMFKQVRIELIHRCQKKRPSQMPQISWEHSSLIDDFYFNPASIYLGPEYTRSAYRDHEFNTFATDETRSIIESLRSHDFNYQNAAINQLRQLRFTELACLNDLFVIGRNIYQSADNSDTCFFSHRCMEFIYNFIREDIPREAKIHLLNGMAYEIYFDHENTVRKVLKKSRLSIILNYLEADEFSESQEFIASKVSVLEDNVLYIPGSKSVIPLSIDIEERDGRFALKTVTHNNRLIYKANNILSDHFFGEKILFTFLKRNIAQYIGANEDNVRFQYIGVELDESNKGCDIEVSFPLSFNHYISQE